MYIFLLFSAQRKWWNSFFLFSTSMRLRVNIRFLALRITDCHLSIWSQRRISYTKIERKKKRLPRKRSKDVAEARMRQTSWLLQFRLSGNYRRFSCERKEEQVRRVSGREMQQLNINCYFFRAPEIKKIVMRRLQGGSMLIFIHVIP